MADPIRFTPDMETVAPDEAETGHDLDAALHEILETTSANYGRAVRSVHAKGHGIVRATLTVKDGLPPTLAQGLFATPGHHEAILRFSTNAGDILDDSIGLPRGLAIKVLGVEGDRLEGSAGDATQDFIMVNGPAFAAADPKAFLSNLKLLAKTTDRAEGLKKLAATFLRGAEAVLETFGGKSATLMTLGGAPQVHPLGQTYYSQTAFLYGPYVAKFSLAPVSAKLVELADATISTADRPDALREVIAEEFAEHGGTWELRVQLLTDRETMPIEDPSVPWDEAASPFVAVATIEAEPQPSWTRFDSTRTEEALSFSVWHGLAAHRPLGGVNRVRRKAYEMSAAFRGRFNGCPIHEPRALAELEPAE